MKLKHILPAVVGVAALLAACTPDEHDLDSLAFVPADLVRDVAYTVDVDQSTNTVTMKSLLGSEYTALWNHPQGWSRGSECVIRIPFAGDYPIVFGVETQGGIVYGDTTWISVERLNGELLSDPLWTLLAGGNGEEKKWVLALDENGALAPFAGPLFFRGTDDGWDTEHGSAAPEGADSWAWDADWAGNGSWLFGSTGAMNYGYMVFDLKNGANITVYDAYNQTETKGTYIIDPEAHTMKLSGAKMLHDPGRNDIVTAWGEIRIFTLEENTMQLGVLRDNDPNEGPCYLLYNFITEGYVPPTDGPTDVEVTDPEYGDDANTDLTTTVTTTKTWRLVETAPYDWYRFDKATGQWTSFGFASLAEYNEWAPQPDAKAVALFSLQMTKTKDTAGQYVLTTTQGETIEGDFTTDGAEIDFGRPITFFTAEREGAGWGLAVTAQTLRIVKKEMRSGVAVLWLGTPKATNAAGQVTEYLCLKVIEVVETGGAAVPARNVAVDESKLLWGDIEGKGNLRLEIYNAWGAGTANDSPIPLDEMYCDEKMVVTFTVTGLGTLSQPCTAFLMNSVTEVWKPEDEGAATVEVTGDGTYTLTQEGAMTFPADGANLVFLIDILGVADATDADLTPEDGRCPDVTFSGVTIKMDGREATGGGTPSKPSIRVNVDNSKILWGDLEGKGNLRIELYNAWGSGTANDSPIPLDEMNCAEKMAVTFTLAGLGTLSQPCTAFLMNSVANVWNAEDEGAATVEVTGDGTYTLTQLGAMAFPADGANLVFLIDILGVADATDTDLTTGDDHRCPNVAVTIDSIKLD